MISEKIRMALSDSYSRSNPSFVANALARLGISAESDFGLFYQEFCGGLCNPRHGYTLGDIIDDDPNIEDLTCELRKLEPEIPDHYIVLSEPIAGGLLIYDSRSGAVYDADLHGEIQKMLDGKLKPEWCSFQQCIEDFLPVDSEPEELQSDGMPR